MRHTCERPLPVLKRLQDNPQAYFFCSVWVLTLLFLEWFSNNCQCINSHCIPLILSACECRVERWMRLCRSVFDPSRNNCRRICSEASPIRGAWIRAILMAYGERGNGKQTHHHTIDCQQQQNQQDSCNILMGDFGNMMNITPNARSDQWEIYNLLTCIINDIQSI